MNGNMKESGARVGVAVAAAVVASTTPSIALAEISGADILLPKTAEFVPALIAFIVIWFVLAKLAWPSILGMMEKRQAKIAGDLDAAEKAKVQATEAVKSYEAQIADAHREAEKIVSQAKKEAEEERSRVLADAHREATEIVSKSHNAVESERKKAMIELSGQVVDLSVEIASKVIGDNLSEDQQRRLAEKYLMEVSAPHGN